MRVRPPRRDASGAATVEFALVSVILFPLLFGMLQYGLLFNDYLQVRQGVRQAARTGAVENWAADPTCAALGSNALTMKCYAKAQIAPVTGPIAVYVKTPGTTTPAWTKGQPFLVCAVVKTAGAGGLIPMPNGGYVLAKTQMAIEQDSPAPTGTFPVGDTDPSGKNWSWCS